MRAQTLTRTRPAAAAATFDQLQERLAESIAPTGEPRSLVVVPSRTVDKWHEPAAETQAYEERLLCSLLELRDPAVHLTYVTSSPIAPAIIDYYLALLPPRIRRHARSRLTLVALGEATTRPLSQKLLDRPLVLEHLRRAIADPRRAHLVPYITTPLEREVALALQIPMYGADPRHAHFGTKSGCRALFARAGVSHPLGAEGIRSGGEAIAVIRRLRAAKPSLSRVVVKLNEGVSGEGNALVELDGLPAPGSAGEASAVATRLRELTPEASGVSPAAFLSKLAATGGIVEEWIAARELRSPSVQLQITPSGEVIVVSTHDQILGGPSGQSYLGCRFPAAPAYTAMISAEARKVGDELARSGVVGRLAIDFVVTRDETGRWHPFAIEVNLRKGGTTHPYEMLAHLTGGTYDPASGSFTAPTGRVKHYVATDHMEGPGLRALGRDGVVALARTARLRFDPLRRTGIVFHMLSSLDELGRTGFTAIGDSADEAAARFHQVEQTLLEAAEMAGGALGGVEMAA